MTMSLTRNHLTFLEDLFSAEDLLVSDAETLVFGTDSSRGFEAPWAVVRPTSVEQVQSLLAWANAEKVPLFARASATNVVGACVPRGGGVVVSMLRMNRILEVDGDDFVAVAEPGVVTAALQERVQRDRLFYPPDPASLKVCTIGGNVATNAGGMRALKYGVTRDFVLGLDAVIPGGELLRLGSRTHKNVVGLDLRGLFVGSEGMLGILTRVILKLLPLPETSASLLASYAELDQALQQALAAAREIFRAGILPVALELMTRETLEAVARTGNVPWSGEPSAALLIKLDGSADALAPELKRLIDIIDASGPTHRETGMGPDEEEPLWEVRRLINPASFQVAPDKLSDDITVPRGRVATTIRGIREIGERVKLPILCFGHLGDGNIHVNIMYDASRQSEAERAREAKEAVLRLVIDQQGVLSGEHGVGLSKLAYLDMQLSRRERHIMRGVKRSFDPHGIMNPGKGI